MLCGLIALPIQAQSPSGKTYPLRWSNRIQKKPVPRPKSAAPTQRSGIQRVLFQQPGGRPTQGPRDYKIDLEPPGHDVLFTLDSEKEFFERMKQEALDRNPAQRIEFPSGPVLADQPYHGRAWPARHCYVEPSYVCHNRLYFEQINSDRYGWEIAGIFQPLLSTAIFWKDVALFPYNYGTDLCRCHDCSAGKCLPGDPVPYMWYPPELSASGLLLEAATVGAILAIFP